MAIMPIFLKIPRWELEQLCKDSIKRLDLSSIDIAKKWSACSSDRDSGLPWTTSWPRFQHFSISS